MYLILIKPFNLFHRCNPVTLAFALLRSAASTWTPCTITMATLKMEMHAEELLSASLPAVNIKGHLMLFSTSKVFHVIKMRNK